MKKAGNLLERRILCGEAARKKEKKKEAYWKGSYTIEAAAIIPIMLLVLAALVFCAFYVHDRAVFQSIACEIAAAGSNCYTEKEQKAVISGLKKEARAGRFLGSRNISANVSLGKREINAFFSANYPVPGMAVRYFSKGKLRIKRGWKGKKEDPAETIRLIRGAERILNRSEQSG